MKSWRTLILCTGLLISTGNIAIAEEPIRWENWSPSVFTQAKKEHKLVILDLEAVWCHWCHVMDQSTYSNSAVIQEMNRHFIPVRVDQDAMPDLANRFRDYGWPATIIFSPDGQPLVKRAGYIEPKEMLETLQKVAAHPKKEDSEVDEGKGEQATSYTLSPMLRKTLQEEHRSLYDTAQASWGAGEHKFMDADSVEYSITLALEGNLNAAHRAQQTLTAEQKLIDPIWGGVYQYSTGGVWSNPHTEKIMSVQADALRMYALSYSLWHRSADLKAATAIKDYLKTFLTSPDNAFYTSQDADVISGQHNNDYFKLTDMERRKQGIPKVDQHIYARENGWAISALLAFYQATQDRSALEAALKSAEWTLEHRALPNGGFRHDATDQAAAPYLGDSLAMGQAFLNLYTATGDRRWLTLSQETAHFIEAQFKKENNQPGYLTAAHAEVPYTDRIENLRLARWTNLLNQMTSNAKYRQMAERAMTYNAKAAVAEDGFPAAPLLVDYEMRRAPLHITVVGSKKDAVARQLFEEALRYPTFYKRVEWWDAAEGPLPNADVSYPKLSQSAAFICTNHRCSLPILQAEALRPRIEQLNYKSTSKSHAKPQLKVNQKSTKGTR